jgi:alanine racemase
MQHRRVWAEIDLDAITANLSTIRAAIGPSKRIMAIVKANAYGHEAIPIGWHLASQGVDLLGVGDSQEAIELRRAGISIPILVLGAIVSGELSDVVANDIAVTVHSSERVRVLEREARRARRPVSVHLKVDTGMARLGCKPASALELARLVHSCDHLRFDGICTHFSSVGLGDDGFTDRQIRTFNRVVGEIERAGIPVPHRHAAASAAILSGIASHLDMVRPGLSLYGIGPTPALQAGLTPALSLKTQVIFLKDCPAQTPVGYNRTHVTPQRTRVATLPVGYNDGYPFRLGGRGQVIVRGRKCSVIGRVSMDYLTIDVGHVPGVSVGDEVILIGSSGRENITATDLAEQCGTIPYEILTRIGRRVTRVYTGGRTSQQSAPEAESRGFGILARPEAPALGSEIEPGRR